MDDLSLNQNQNFGEGLRNNKKKILLITVFIIFLIVIILAGLFLFKNSKNNQSTSEDNNLSIGKLPEPISSEFTTPLEINSSDTNFGLINNEYEVKSTTEDTIFSPDGNNYAYIGSRPESFLIKGNTEWGPYKEISNVSYDSNERIIYSVKNNNNQWCVMIDDQETDCSNDQIESIFISPNNKVYSIREIIDNDDSIKKSEYLSAEDYKSDIYNDILDVVFDKKNYPIYRVRDGYNKESVIFESTKTQSPKYDCISEIFITPADKIVYAAISSDNKREYIIIDGKIVDENISEYNDCGGPGVGIYRKSFAQDSNNKIAYIVWAEGVNYISLEGKRISDLYDQIYSESLQSSKDGTLFYMGSQENKNFFIINKEGVEEANVLNYSDYPLLILRKIEEAKGSYSNDYYYLLNKDNNSWMYIDYDYQNFLFITNKKEGETRGPRDIISCWGNSKSEEIIAVCLADGYNNNLGIRIWYPDGQELDIGMNNYNYVYHYRPVISINGDHFAFVGVRGNNPYDKYFLVLDGKEIKENTYPQEEIQFLSDNTLVYVEKRDREFVISNNNISEGYDKIHKLSFSSNGKQIVFIAQKEKDGKYMVVHNGKEGKAYDFIYPYTLEFSPDSQYFAYVVQENYDETDNKEFIVVNEKEGKKYNYILSMSLKFSPDSKKILYEGESQIIINEDVLNKDAENIVLPTFSQDGSHFAYVVNVENKEEYVVLDGKKQKSYNNVNSLIFTPDNKLVYLAKNSDNGQEFLVIDGIERGSYDDIISFSLSLDKKGEKIAFLIKEKLSSAGDGYLVVVCDIGLNYCDKFSTQDYIKPSFNILFSPDGSKVVYSALGSMGKWYMMINGVPLRGYDKEAFAPVFSSDSRHFAYLGINNSGFYINIDGKEDGPYDYISNPLFLENEKGKYFAYGVIKNNELKWIVEIIDSPSSN